jgi:ferrous iron transport protein A
MELTHIGGTRRAAPGSVGSAARSAAATLTVAGAGAEGFKLEELATGAVARVVSVAAVDADGSAELPRRLAELGFLPGEKVRIVARGFLGREPIAVRIGTGTFALRLFEAACIRVSLEHSQRA